MDVSGRKPNGTSADHPRPPGITGPLIKEIPAIV
jgi:hypothetical protein